MKKRATNPKKATTPPFSLEPTENPRPKGTFGDVGAFFRVRASRPLSNAPLELPYKAVRARHVDEASLRLFRWDDETRALELVPLSGVDTKRRVVWGPIDRPGVYGAIGLPRDPDRLRTVAAFSLFSDAELRGSPELVARICGLILCGPGPGAGGGARGGVCEQCMGIGRQLPESQIVFGDPRHVFVPPARPPAWGAFRHDAKNTGQSGFDGPTSKPSVLWSFSPGSPILSTPVVGGDGTVYVVASDFYVPSAVTDVHALDGNTGQIKWSLRIAPPGKPISYDPTPALGPDGTLYVNGAEGGGLVAIRPNGLLKWRFNRPHRRLTRPVPSADGRIYCGSRGEGIIALDRLGREVWPSPFPHGLSPDPNLVLDRTPLVVRDDGTLILVGDSIRALTRDAQVLWEQPLQYPNYEDPTVTSDGRILTFSDEVWSPSGVQRPSLPQGGIFAAGQNGVVFASASGMITAIDATNQILWSRVIPTLNGGNMATAAIGRDGTVHIALMTDPPQSLDLVALDPATGQTKWLVQIPGGMPNALHNPVIGRGGTLLITGKNTLWAVR